MTDVVIFNPVRTPVGRYGGALASLTATDFAAWLMTERASRTGLCEGDIDDVILGRCYPSGESPAIRRAAALDAGLGTSVAGLQFDPGVFVDRIVPLTPEQASRKDIEKRTTRPREA